MIENKKMFNRSLENLPRMLVDIDHNRVRF